MRRQRRSFERYIIELSAGMPRADAARHLPKAVHVFDRFHVVKLFSDKLSQLRRSIQNEAQARQKKHVIKGTRWLLLKNPCEFDRA